MIFFEIVQLRFCPFGISLLPITKESLEKVGRILCGEVCITNMQESRQMSRARQGTVGTQVVTTDRFLLPECVCQKNKIFAFV